ncbi:hypothetical protein C8R46DRAFT_832983, partial [Mycena filopes]
IPRPSPITFDNPTALDLLLKATLETCMESEEATQCFYGPVYAQSDPIPIYIGTTMKFGCAAFALWRGAGSKRNQVYVVEGEATGNRASVLAVLCAVRDCPVDRSVVIYTSSEYIIRLFAYWAGDNETRGWYCANGDELRDAVEWIARQWRLSNFA